MTDDQQAQMNPEGTQEAPMPSAEEQAAQLETGEVGENVSSPESNGALPSDVKERTAREFEKLKTQLREERAKREYLENVYTQIQPKKVEPVVTPIYDPDTGLLNEQAITIAQQQAAEAQQRAIAAEQAVQRYMDDQEKREVYAKHPDLNPDNVQTHDKNLHTVTRSLLLQSMVEPDEFGGKQLSFMEAAELAKSMIGKSAVAVSNKQLEQLAPKEQASTEVTGNSSRRSQVDDNLDELRYKTRKGDILSVVERMKNMSNE